MYLLLHTFVELLFQADPQKESTQLGLMRSCDGYILNNVTRLDCWRL